MPVYRKYLKRLQYQMVVTVGILINLAQSLPFVGNVQFLGILHAWELFIVDLLAK